MLLGRLALADACRLPDLEQGKLNSTFSNKAYCPPALVATKSRVAIRAKIRRFLGRLIMPCNCILGKLRNTYPYTKHHNKEQAVIYGPDPGS